MEGIPKRVENTCIRLIELNEHWHMNAKRQIDENSNLIKHV